MSWTTPRPPSSFPSFVIPANAGIQRSLLVAETMIEAESLHDRTGSITIQGIGSRQKEAGKYDIEKLYTPLRSLGGVDEKSVMESKETISLEKLLPQNHRLLIEGQPGAGKTTFLKLVAAMLTRDLLQTTPHPEGGYWCRRYLGMKEESVRYPLFLRLSELEVLLAGEQKPTATDRHRLLDLLLTSANASNDPAWRDHWQTLLKNGRAILLLDGLDEVADAEVRKQVIFIVQDAARNWGKCPIIITSRPFGVKQMKGLDFHHAVIDPFGPEDIRTFLSNWEGRIIRLPDASLWEKAATSPIGEYPWGKAEPTLELANFGRNESSSSPVGLYPAGNGPYDRCDLAGNVWEWQRNLNDEENTAETPLDPEVSTDDLLALRGGSWVLTAVTLRSDYQNWDRADGRGNFWGFRVAAAPAKPPS